MKIARASNPDDYEYWTTGSLTRQLKARGLPFKGDWNAKINRLIEDDEANQKMGALLVIKPRLVERKPQMTQLTARITCKNCGTTFWQDHLEDLIQESKFIS